MQLICPKGGRLEISYESDDYAYVQDREATMMYMVRNAFAVFHPEEIDGSGFYTSDAFEGLAGGSDLPRLYTSSDDLNLYMVYDIPENQWLSTTDFSQTEADEYIKNHCVLGELPDSDDPGRIMDNLYFRFYLNTDAFDNTVPADEVMDPNEERPEFVSGFATINENAAGGHWAGAIKNGSYFKKAFVLMNATNAEFKSVLSPVQPVNPITKSGWQFSMLNTRYNVLDEPMLKQDMDFNSFLEELGNASFINGLISLFSGPNDIMRDDKIANVFDPTKSWLRLGTMDGNKFGGGCRVKSLTMYDNWDQMTSSENSFEYIKEYSYKLPDSQKSSGVASYEPLMGADEIPQHVPDIYTHKDLDETYSKYTELPYGESFFPSPMVGYSYVEVKNKSYTNVNRTATGKTAYEFFTAKDFPVKTDQTELIPLIKKPTSSFSLFNNTIVNLYTGTQGYLVEVNDMHGKPRKVSIYPEGDFDNPITETEYEYFADKANETLTNTVRLIDDKGHISEGDVGVTYDFSVDLRNQSTQSYGATNQANLELISIGGVPVVAPILIGNNDYSYSSTKLAVTTKVVTRNGILKDIITRKDGSRITMRNELFDAETGMAVLTSSQDEFDKNYYKLTYPSHWVYPGMDLAYKNDNFQFSATSSFSDYINPNTGLIGSELFDALTPGDEMIFKVYIDDADPDEPEYDAICWVYAETDGASISYHLIDKDGSQPGITGDVIKISGEVIRSGHHNIPSSPIASVVSKYIPETDPGELTSTLAINGDNKILQANSTEYSDRWQNFCISNDELPYCIVGADQHETNPYNRGFLGIWKPLVSYLYLTNREYTYEQDANTTDFDGQYVNIENDGTYENFSPFWQCDGSAWSKEITDWTWTTKTQVNNPYTDEVENVNALNVYSSASYGYNNEKPVIVCNNAEYKEVGFENFEDEYYYEALQKDCDQQHFNFAGGGVVTNSFAHTGNFSYKIPYSYDVSYTTSLTQHHNPREADNYGESFMIESGDCLPSFSPDAFSANDQKYVLTFWLKRKYTGNTPVTYEDFTVEVNLNGDDIVDADIVKSPIIEDWQRFEYTFTIPSGSDPDDLIISITNNDEQEVYVDDIRIQPSDAVAKTYVYDFRTQRLMSELDENHFATFYEYDEDGKLVRMKKETEKGVMTIQEGRYYTKKSE